MNRKQWDAYVTYLDIIHRRTDRVWREHDEFHQFPDGKEDFRDALDRKYFAEKMEIALSTLTERERKVLCFRFGIGLDAPMSLDECGTIFCVGRERIRQIEYKALRKMRNPARHNILFEPEELKRRREEEIKEELERQRIKNEEREKERLKQAAHKAWWETEGKAQHERQQEENRRKRWERMQQRNDQDRIRWEAEKAEEAKRIKEHNEHYEELTRYENYLLRQREIARQKAKYEEIQEEENRLEMRCMKAVALELIKGVQANQHRLSQKTVARLPIENNETRPYIWDSFKRKRRYIKDGKP